MGAVSPKVDAEGAEAPGASPSVSPRIWVLADHRAGNVSQATGIAKRLGKPFTTKHITYNRKAKLPNLLLRPGFSTVNKGSRLNLQPPWPDVVIAAGRRTAPVALGIKKASGGETTLIHIMNPQMHKQGFDCIILPGHDKADDQPNLLRTMAVPHKLTPRMLTAAATQWGESFSTLPRPHIGLIVGGDTRNGAFTPKAAEALGQLVNRAVESTGGSLLATTSPRTSFEATEKLRQQLTVPCYFHHWFYSGAEGNPYMGILALADAVIVTGDSMSMISEACFTGRPVYIADIGDQVSEKHRRLHYALFNDRRALPLSGNLDHTNFMPEPLDATGEIAGELARRFPQLAPRISLKKHG